MARIEKEVENLISTAITENGYELYDIEYVKEGSEYSRRLWKSKWYSKSYIR